LPYCLFLPQFLNSSKASPVCSGVKMRNAPAITVCNRNQKQVMPGYIFHVLIC
jgi:hypothetical protein